MDKANGSALLVDPAHQPGGWYIQDEEAANRRYAMDRELCEDTLVDATDRLLDHAYNLINNGQPPAGVMILLGIGSTSLDTLQDARDAGVSEGFLETPGAWAQRAIREAADERPTFGQRRRDAAQIVEEMKLDDVLELLSAALQLVKPSS